MSVKSKYAGQGYAAIRHITELPIKSRRALAIGRGGKKIKPRKFHLNVAELDQLREEFKETNKIPVPFNKGAYHFTVVALIQLGVNQKHKLATVQATFKELMSDKETQNAEGKTLWQRFRDKEAKGSDETSLDWADRFEQNIRVLQRFGGSTPYGLKLHEVGTKVCRYKGLVIDILGNRETGIYIRLNTESNRPVNELKTRNVTAKPVKRAKRKTVRRSAATTPTAEGASASAETATAVSASAETVLA